MSTDTQTHETVRVYECDACGEEHATVFRLRRCPDCGEHVHSEAHAPSGWTSSLTHRSGQDTDRDAA